MYTVIVEEYRERSRHPIRFLSYDFVFIFFFLFFHAEWHKTNSVILKGYKKKKEIVEFETAVSRARVVLTR